MKNWGSRFLKKMLIMQFPKLYENLDQKIFCFFFQPQIEFRTQINIFWNFFLHVKFNILCA